MRIFDVRVGAIILHNLNDLMGQIGSRLDRQMGSFRRGRVCVYGSLVY
jgi:hypothetical protein